MTCIAGVVHGKKVYIAGDSCGSDGQHRAVMGDSKVFTRGPFAFGYCGSFRLGQLVEHVMGLPEPLVSQSDMAYLCGPFISSLRECLRQHGNLGLSDGTEHSHGAMLLGYRGKLYELGTDFAVLEQRDNIAAVGSGSHYALGALVVLGGAPKKRLASALAAAAHLAPHVMGPFNLVSV